MNYTESFNDFASRVGPTDLALYAGAALVIYVLFKDKLSPIQSFLVDLFKKVKAKNPVPSVASSPKEDVFFALVNSWKQTRDLAVKSGCEEAVKTADQMFPYLSPSVCSQKDKVS